MRSAAPAAPRMTPNRPRSVTDRPKRRAPDGLLPGIVLGLLLSAGFAGIWASTPAAFPVLAGEGGAHLAATIAPARSGACPNGTVLNASSGNFSLVVCIRAVPTLGPTAFGVFQNVSGGTSPYDFQIAWGDGSTYTNRSLGNLSSGAFHRYASNGTYTLTGSDIDGAFASLNYTTTVTAGSTPPALSVQLSARELGGRTSGPCGANVSACTQIAWAISGGSAPYDLLRLTFGDGSAYGGNTTIAATGSVVHVYPTVATVTTYTVQAIVGDPAISANATGTVSVQPLYNVLGGNATSSVRWLTASSFAATASNATMNLSVFGMLVPGPSWVGLSLNGTLRTTGNGSSVVGLSYGDRTGTSISLNRSGGGGFSATHNYTLSGPVALTANASLGGNASIAVVVPLNLTFSNRSSGGTGNNSSAGYPSAVEVTIAATPVTGPAPLPVQFSAYIDGGSPPFVVSWSLPGGNGSANGTGLSVIRVYASSGWYPATAFVYNTSTRFGTVLVGYGSVWVYVSPSNGSGGGGSGSGSGGSPNGSRYGPQGHPAPTMASLSGLVSNGLVDLAIAIAGVAAVVGYRRSRRSSPPGGGDSPVGRAPPVGPGA